MGDLGLTADRSVGSLRQRRMVVKRWLTLLRPVTEAYMASVKQSPPDTGRLQISHIRL